MTKNYKEILSTFFMRCKLKPDYKVAVYLRDESTFKKLVDIADDWSNTQEYGEKFDDDTGMRRVKGVKFGWNGQENSAKFEFANGSELRFGVFTTFSKGEYFHAILFDKAMRQDELDRSIGKAIAYKERNVDSAMWNPDPIPFRIAEE